MQNPNEDWRHAYIGALAREKKEAQQRREGIRWAIITGVITGVSIGGALLMSGAC